jgi:hypothetical protein
MATAGLPDEFKDKTVEEVSNNSRGVIGDVTD